MKKIISTTILFALFTAVNAQEDKPEIKPHVTFEVGTSTESIKSKTYAPVVAAFAGAMYMKENRLLNPFIEAGLGTHIDNKNFAFFDFHAGFDGKYMGFYAGLSALAGMPKEDTYVKDGQPPVLLFDGMKKGVQLSPVVAFRGYLGDYVYMQGAYRQYNTTNHMVPTFIATIGIRGFIND